MTSIEKLIKKFKNKPESLRFVEIEKILIDSGCEKIQAKGSHIKFKYSRIENDLVIPVHGNDCKDFYKKQALKFFKSLK